MTDLHADLSLPARVESESLEWTDSPLPGVERKMLERDGGEVARATSLVRFAPGSRFSEHEHGGGEELLVLEGVFSDESGDFQAGTYVRNPPGSRHAPHSRPGCIILVKLRQMRDDERERVVVDTGAEIWEEIAAGVERLPLFAGGGETVSMLRLAPGAALGERQHPGGEELFVLAGELVDSEGRHPHATWLRRPGGSSSRLQSQVGCTLYVKEGHLAAGAEKPAPTDDPSS